jgi:hypothetical protein
MNKMSNEIEIIPDHDGWDAQDENFGGGARYAKFDAGKWSDRTGQPLPLEPYVAVDCRKEAIRWLEKIVIDRISGDQKPDVDSLNDAVPRSEWEEGFDHQPKPPWSMAYNVFLVCPADGSRLICSNSTFGMKAAYYDLKDKVGFMRKYKGAHVVPVIKLASVMMKTRFGMKTRPHFEVISWQVFGGPSSEAPAITGPAPVTPPTPAEITGDEIPDFGTPAPAAAKKAAKHRMTHAEEFAQVKQWMSGGSSPNDDIPFEKA